MRRSPGRIGSRVMLLSSGLEDKRFTVDGETDISLVVDSVQLWPRFQAKKSTVSPEYFVCFLISFTSCVAYEHKMHTKS